MPGTIQVINDQTVIVAGENTAEAARQASIATTAASAAAADAVAGVTTALAADVTASQTARDAAQAAQTGAQTARQRADNTVPFASWASLVAATGMAAGDRARVRISDTGTHTDPVVGGTVNNAGDYTYSTSPAGWQRTGDLDSQTAKASADAAATSAASIVTDRTNQDLAQFTLLPGAAPTGATVVYTDKYGRLIQAISALGSPLIERPSIRGVEQQQMILLAGMLPSGVTNPVVDKFGRLVQYDFGDGSRMVQRDASNRDLSTFVSVSRRFIGTSGNNGGAMPGSLRTPSTLLEARRQVPSTAIAKLTGTTPNRVVKAVRGDGTEYALSRPGEDPDTLIQNGDTVTWRRSTPAYVNAQLGGGTPPTVGNLVSGSVAVEADLAGAGTIYMLAGYGQSNSVGYPMPTTGMPDVVTTATKPARRGRVYMFAEGVRQPYTTNAILVGFPEIARVREAFERVMPDTATNPPGETMMSGAGYQFTQPGVIPSTDKVIIATFGFASHPINYLRKGTPAYENLLLGVNRANQMAKAQGVSLIVPAVPYVQGEADFKNTTYAAYWAAYLQLQTDLDTDIKAITGQTQTVIMAAAAPSSWTASSITTTPIVQVWLDAALAYPTRFICTGPMYRFPMAGGVDALHLSYQGHRAHGEHMGRAIARKLAGVSQPCLYVTSAIRSGTTVTVTVAGAEGNLASDTSVVSDPGQFGIRFWDDSGETAISSIVPSGTSTLTLTLAATPSGTNPRVEIAARGTSGAGGGPTTGPRACIRDTVTDLLGMDGTTPMHKYLVSQIIPVT